MEIPTLTTMVVLYNMSVRLNTDILVRELPLTPSIIKIEKQGILRRGESKKDRIRHRVPAVPPPPKRTTGFGHNSITLVVMSAGDGMKEKEITVKIFQNGVFHITGVLNEAYDRHVTSLLRTHIMTTCPHAVTGEWTPDNRRVVLMNYKSRISGIANLSRETLHAALRRSGWKSNYEPAVYPAVKIYFADHKWIAKVFRTGNVILTGMTSSEECVELTRSLSALLRTHMPSHTEPPCGAAGLAIRA